MRDREQRCSICDHWDPGTEESPGADSRGGEPSGNAVPAGRCRRHPPVIVRDAAGDFVGMWPVTGPDDRCGEWRPLGQAGEVADVSAPASLAGVPAEPPLDPQEERWLRNTSMAQALLVLPAEKRDAVLEAVLTEEERMSPTPPDDFCDRVEAYFAAQRGM